VQSFKATEPVAFIPITDMAPLPLGLIWVKAHENARIRAFAQVAERVAASDRKPAIGAAVSRAQCRRRACELTRKPHSGWPRAPAASACGREQRFALADGSRGTDAAIERQSLGELRLCVGSASGFAEYPSRLEPRLSFE